MTSGEPLSGFWLAMSVCSVTTLAVLDREWRKRRLCVRVRSGPVVGVCLSQPTGKSACRHGRTDSYITKILLMHVYG